MAIYLIDFENVGNEGLKGIELLEKEDAVHILYNEAISRLTFPMAEKIFGCKAQVKFFAASVGGNNALDFQLSSWLGYLYGQKQEEIYNIISKDKSFLHAAEFWRGLKEVGEAKIYCWPSISLAQKRNLVELTKAKEPEELKEEEVKEAKTEKEVKETELLEETEPLEEIEPLKKTELLKETVTSKKKAKSKTKNRTKIEEKDEVIQGNNWGNANELGRAVQEEKKIQQKEEQIDTREKLVIPENKEESFAEKKEDDIEISAEIQKNVQKTGEGLKEIICQILGKKIRVEEEDKICNLVTDSDSKMDLYRMIVTTFGQKRGQEIYRGLKPEYHKIKKMGTEEIKAEVG